MYHKAFGDRAPLEPAVELTSLPDPLAGFRGLALRDTRHPIPSNRSPPLPAAVAKDGIKKSAHCFETITQLRNVENSWLRH